MNKNPLNNIIWIWFIFRFKFGMENGFALRMATQNLIESLILYRKNLVKTILYRKIVETILSSFKALALWGRTKKKLKKITAECWTKDPWLLHRKAPKKEWSRKCSQRSFVGHKFSRWVGISNANGFYVQSSWASSEKSQRRDTNVACAWLPLISC